MRKAIREPVNSLTHLITAGFAVLGAGLLLYLSRSNGWQLVSLLVYGVSLVFLFTASGLYHLVQGSARKIQIFRKLDHSAIFVLIAGSYTPVCFNLFNGFWQWGMLAIIWTLALAGVISKIFIIQTPRWFTALVYLVMGWLAILGLPEIVTNLPVGAIVWLVLGGLAYSLGAVIYATKILNFYPGVFGFHEVWHIFVILGALCHFIMILVYIAI